MDKIIQRGKSLFLLHSDECVGKDLEELGFLKLKLSLAFTRQRLNQTKVCDLDKCSK